MKPIQKIRFFIKIIILFSILFINCINQAFAHGDHVRFSRYIIDPLITHHSILEDEQRMNFFYFKNQRSEEQIGNGVGVSMELAYAFSDLFGIEVFIPYYRSDVSNGTLRGLGDIEVQPLKLSFYRHYNLVMTGVVSFVLPTGDKTNGFGSGRTRIEPHFFVDAVLGQFGIQANLVYGRTVSGESESEMEYNLAISHSIFKGSQSWSVLVELNGGLELTGEEKGESELYLTPGLKYATSGWHIGVGVQFPVTDNRSADLTGLLQAGFHFNLGHRESGKG